MILLFLDIRTNYGINPNFYILSHEKCFYYCLDSYVDELFKS